MLALRFRDLYDDGVFVGPEDCLSGIFAGVCCGVKPQPFPVEVLATLFIKSPEELLFK
jgi:hypothetical protein